MKNLQFSASCEENLLSKVKVSNLQREEKINSEFRVLGKAVRGASQESRERGQNAMNVIESDLLYTARGQHSGLRLRVH